MECQEPIKEAKKFGQVLAVCFFLLSAFLFWRQKAFAPHILIVGTALQIFALCSSPVLIPIRTGWMKAGHVLGWVNTRLLLIIIFFLVFTPIRFILWVLRVDLLRQRIEKNKTSYWQLRHNDFQSAAAHYERMF